jgi:ribosome biogenesis GTPase
MKALVYRSTGSWYDVYDETGKKWRARTKGILRIDGITSTNPIAVGDWVQTEPENELENTLMITGILDRHNYIVRQSPHNKNLHHIIASNLDQSILIATLKDPRTSNGFIDRFLVASEAYHIPAVILFNKTDTWRKKEQEHFEIWKDIYESIGYKVAKMSVAKQEGIEEIKALLSSKISLFSGHSGVGKSSLLNALLPGVSQHTKEVSGWSGKGMHTTTFAEMFDLPDGGKIIDTPGVREFGLVHIEPNELSHYFPEMRDLLNDCQFNDCLHTDEPGCAIKAGIISQGTHFADGTVPVFAERYISYINILGSIPDKGWH